MNIIEGSDAQQQKYFYFILRDDYLSSAVRASLSNFGSRTRETEKEKKSIISKERERQRERERERISKK